MDPNKRYFVMSFRFNKSKAEDFGLIPLSSEGVYADKEDGSLWARRQLYDFGWGLENGFMRLPQLTFEQLWYLLLNSNIEGNKYGAATIIEEEYASKLRDLLLDLLNDDNFKHSESFKNALKILKLDKDPRNRSETKGKPFDEVKKDYDIWKYISGRASQITGWADKVAKVKICWISYEEGGRKAPPQVGARYVVPVIFDNDEEQTRKWLAEFICSEVDENNCSIGDFSYVLELSPFQNLCTGNRFRLFERGKLVATGVVLDKKK